MLIEVDTGVSGTKEWELSVPCLEHMLPIARDHECNVALSKYDENRVDGLETLGPILKARGVIWRFTLKTNVESGSQSSYSVVTDVCEADKEMLGSVILSNRA